MKRRDFLKQSAFALAGLAMLSLGCGSDKTAKADAPQPEVKQSTNEGASQAMNNNGKKILVAYFSWSGNTKAVAEEIHKQVGGVQRCMSDLEARAQGANFTDYLCLSGSSAKNSQGEITSWVKKTQN